LVSYNFKHNEANGEGGQDGSDDNRSWNCGVEGPTDDPAINALREQQKRNFLATLFLSQGVPMLLAGDEMGRSQNGNNNAYCQDNELSWVDWDQRDVNLALLGFTRTLMDLRRAHPVLRRQGWFQGRPIRGKGVADCAWFDPSGEEMTDEQWDEGFAKSLAVFLNGNAIPHSDPRGKRIVDDSLLLCFNAHHEAIEWRLPPAKFARSWETLFDTSVADLADLFHVGAVSAGDTRRVAGRSVLVLRRAS
jgi:glycogen operon protein